jgi:hypothetical protein
MPAPLRTGLVFAALLLIADQASKYWVLEVINLPQWRNIPVIEMGPVGLDLTMVWNRGVAEDYDGLEALGNPGWGWKEMLPCLRALEDHQMGTSDYRGTGGPIAITTNPNRNGLADALACSGDNCCSAITHAAAPFDEAEQSLH